MSFLGVKYQFDAFRLENPLKTLMIALGCILCSLTALVKNAVMLDIMFIWIWKSIESESSNQDALSQMVDVFAFRAEHGQ